jgi:hypothetical protein
MRLIELGPSCATEPFSMHYIRYKSPPPTGNRTADRTMTFKCTDRQTRQAVYV